MNRQYRDRLQNALTRKFQVKLSRDQEYALWDLLSDQLWDSLRAGLNNELCGQLWIDLGGDK